MDVGDIGAVLAILMAGLSSWFTYRSSNKATEGDHTLRGLQQLNDNCMQRCARLEAREQELERRVTTLEHELEHKNDELDEKDDIIAILRGQQPR